MKNSENNITKKDIKRAFIKWHMFSETSLNFERMQSLAFCNSISEILRKLYKDDKELSEALERHLNMYNTQANWGTLINGITIAMEEKMATTDNDDESKTLITGLKTGLMGPIAGIGDTLDFGTIRPIIIGLCVPFVLQGNVVAALIPLIYQVVYMFIFGNIMINKGYEKGKESIVNILQSGSIHKVISYAGMFGLLMMGALSATYVKISTPIVVTSSAGTQIAIQEMLDKIAPNILSILTVFGIYFYISKRGSHFIKILVTVVIISLIFSFFGIL